MRIYKTNYEDLVEIYDLTQNQEKVSTFKRKQMRLFPEEQIFFKASTNSTNDKVLTTQRNLKFDDLNWNKNGIWHRFENYEQTSKQLEIQEELLNSYYDGIFDNNETKNIKYNYNTLVHYLFTNPKYNNTTNNYQMDNIMRLTFSLQQFHFLIQEKYNMIRIDNIDTLLGLFDIEFKGELSIDELKKIYNGVIDYPLYKAKESANVLSSSKLLVKKRK